jgi:hypothetical protein
LSSVKKTKNREREKQTLRQQGKREKSCFFIEKKEGKTAEQNLLQVLMRLLLWVVSLLLLL